MNVDGDKIKRLIEVYGAEKGYESKAYLRRFCEDNGLNYIQFHAYTRGTQNLGIKIVYLLMDIFPTINLNWLLKNEENMFTTEDKQLHLSEPTVKYGKIVSNLQLMHKLEEIHFEIKKATSKEY